MYFKLVFVPIWIGKCGENVKKKKYSGIWVKNTKIVFCVLYL